MNAMTRLGAVLLLGPALAAMSGCGNGDAGDLDANGNPVSSANRAPVVDAGANQDNVVEGTEVTLTGTATDADGSIASYRWTQLSGPKVTLTHADQSITKFVAPSVDASGAKLIFALVVTDNGGQQAGDTVQVTVKDVTTAGGTLSVEDASAAEGDGTMTFTVRLSADMADEVTVKYATQNGTATADSDYTAASGTLNFAAHELTKTIVVSITQDTAHEPSETFLVDLSSASGATIARGEATGTITDDDPEVTPVGDIGYGTGALGALARFTSTMNGAISALVAGNFSGASSSFSSALGRLGQDTGDLATADQASLMRLVQDMIKDAQKHDADLLLAEAGADTGAVIGLDTDVVGAVRRTLSVERSKQAMVLTGSQLPGWSVPAAFGLPFPYPSGATITGTSLPSFLQKNGGRDAHNGVMLYPLPGLPALLQGKPVERIAAYRWDGSQFIEIPVQVDQRFPYFLANSNSSFSVYSGTDQELTYQWDQERWTNTDSPTNPCNAGYGPGMQDPVPGLDDDDEIAFMVQDAGAQAPLGALPADVDPAETLQQVHLVDALNPAYHGVVYLGIKKSGLTAKYLSQKVYVDYQRDPGADQWIDASFFADSDPQKIGTSNTGYGANLVGKVCPDADISKIKNSTDRFPRDATTVKTDTYRWHSSGRWMVREIQIAKPGQKLDTVGRIPGQGVEYRPDLIDRWKGRAFQQAPDSTVSIVGFEDEQVNWEANAILLGDRKGPVRAIRETWGADSGTNVTKTETFYRDAVAYRYHLRVHPIPPDGLYTSWDYNRGAMIPAPGENVQGGRYYTILRPQGVPVDGVNDDIGQIDGIAPVGGQCVSLDAKKLVPPAPDGRCPAYFDVADPTFNLPLAFANWEQISGKGNYGSLVYTFELKGLTSLANPLVIPFYRDDACLDDGTGDDPVQRPYPGEAQSDPRVRKGYVAAAGGDTSDAGVDAAFNKLRCDQKQGAYGAHGVHYLFTQDSDNAFVLGVPIDEVDGQQWQFMVPTEQPTNLGQPYYNIITVPLIPLVAPMPSLPSG